MKSLGSALISLGKESEAEPLLKEARAAAVQHLGASDKTAVEIANVLAVLLDKAGREAEAAALRAELPAEPTAEVPAWAFSSVNTKLAPQ